MPVFAKFIISVLLAVIAVVLMASLAAFAFWIIERWSLFKRRHEVTRSHSGIYCASALQAEKCDAIMSEKYNLGYEAAQRDISASMGITRDET